MLALALVLTQLWFPYATGSWIEFDSLASWMVLSDLTLVALLAVLTLRAPGARARSA